MNRLPLNELDLVNKHGAAALDSPSKEMVTYSVNKQLLKIITCLYFNERLRPKRFQKKFPLAIAVRYGCSNGCNAKGVDLSKILFIYELL